MPTQIRADLARQYGCDVRTISRWRSEGAPLESPEAMRTWLANRRNVPPSVRQGGGTVGQRQGHVSPRDIPRGTESDTWTGPGTVGAASALRRLEAVEVEAFGALQQAVATGDPVQIKYAREGWLKVGDSLRRYDLLVEQSRRQTGEMVQRAQVEQHIEHFIDAFRRAIAVCSGSFANEFAGCAPAEIQTTLRTLLLENVINAAVRLASEPCPAKAPDWLIAAVTRSLANSLIDPGSAVNSRVEAFEKTFQALIEASAQEVTTPRQPEAP